MSFAAFDPVVLADLVMLDDDSPDDMLAQVKIGELTSELQSL